MSGAGAAAGRLIAVVGPSGVGKDSVIDGICAAMPDLRRVRRVITRAPELGGEDYNSVSVPAFEAMAARGDFAVSWGAHGLFYGIPATLHDELALGHDCIANFSRGALDAAAAVFERLLVLNITASPQSLAARLAARGRETPEDIARRLAQAQKPLPEGLEVITLANDGPLDETVAQAVARIQPRRA